MSANSANGVDHSQDKKDHYDQGDKAESMEESVVHGGVCLLDVFVVVLFVVICAMIKRSWRSTPPSFSQNGSRLHCGE
jgi:hypothetical protein